MRRDLAAARAAWLKEAKTDEERATREKSDFLRYKDAQGQYCSARGLLPAGILDACRRVLEENGPRGQRTERKVRSSPLVGECFRLIGGITISAVYPESPDDKRRGSAPGGAAAVRGHVT
jgi:hypothetical protein